MAKQLTVTKKKTAPAKPDTSDLNKYYIEVQNPKNLNRIYISEFSGLNPNNLHYYLDVARKGLNFWKSLLFEEIRRRDLRIGSVCQTRKLAVAKKKWKIDFRSDSSVTETAQNEQKEFIYKNFDDINFVQFITDIVEAQIQGVSTFEITYRIDNNKYCLEDVCYNPNYLLLFNDLTNQYCYLDHGKADAMSLRTLGWNTSQDRIDVTKLQIEELNPLKILEVESLDGNAQNGLLNGCIDSLIWAFLFKNYGLKDWSIYVERFASPGVVGKYPSLMGKADKQKLFEAVRNWGNLFKATIPSDCTLELLTDDSKASTTGLFREYVDYWDKNISIRVLGQSLTTDIGNVGSKAAAQTHDEVREDLVIADMVLVSYTVNKLIKTLMNVNYPKIAEYPKFEFEEEVSIEYKLKRSEIIRNLKVSGWTVSQEDIQEEFDLEVTPSVTSDPGQPASEDQGGDQQTYIKKFIEDYWNKLN